MIKFLFKMFFALVFLLVLAVAGAYVYLNQIAKAGIERGGEYALGVPTSLGSIRINLLRGEIVLAGLTVANPPGYVDPYFLHLSSASTRVDPNEFGQDQINIALLAFDGVDVNIDRGKSGSNYGAILGNLKKFESSDAPATEQEASSGKTFVIDELRITEIHAQIRQEVIAGQKVALKVEVPEVRLQNVGAEQDGVTSAELVGILTKAILEAISRSGGFPSGMLKDLTGDLKGLANVSIELPQGVGERIGQVSDISKQLGGETGKDLGKTLDAIGGLFGKKKKDE